MLNKYKYRIVVKIISSLVVCLFLFNEWSFALSPNSRFKPISGIKHDDGTLQLIENPDGQPQYLYESFVSRVGFLQINQIMSLVLENRLIDKEILSPKGLSLLIDGYFKEALENNGSEYEELKSIFGWDSITIKDKKILLPYENRESGVKETLCYYLKEGKIVLGQLEKIDDSGFVQATEIQFLSLEDFTSPKVQDDGPITEKGKYIISAEGKHVYYLELQAHGRKVGSIHLRIQDKGIVFFSCAEINVMERKRGYGRELILRGVRNACREAEKRGKTPKWSVIYYLSNNPREDISVKDMGTFLEKLGFESTEKVEPQDQELVELIEKNPGYKPLEHQKIGHWFVDIKTLLKGRKEKTHGSDRVKHIISSVKREGGSRQIYDPDGTLASLFEPYVDHGDDFIKKAVIKASDSDREHSVVDFTISESESNAMLEAVTRLVENHPEESEIVVKVLGSGPRAGEAIRVLDMIRRYSDLTGRELKIKFLIFDLLAQRLSTSKSAIKDHVKTLPEEWRGRVSSEYYYGDVTDEACWPAMTFDTPAHISIWRNTWVLNEDFRHKNRSFNNEKAEEFIQLVRRNTINPGAIVVTELLGGGQFFQVAEVVDGSNSNITGIGGRTSSTFQRRKQSFAKLKRYMIDKNVEIISKVVGSGEQPLILGRINEPGYIRWGHSFTPEIYYKIYTYFSANAKGGVPDENGIAKIQEVFDKAILEEAGFASRAGSVSEAMAGIKNSAERAEAIRLMINAGMEMISEIVEFSERTRIPGWTEVRQILSMDHILGYASERDKLLLRSIEANGYKINIAKWIARGYYFMTRKNKSANDIQRAIYCYKTALEDARSLSIDPNTRDTETVRTILHELISIESQKYSGVEDVRTALLDDEWIMEVETEYAGGKEKNIGGKAADNKTVVNPVIRQAIKDGRAVKFRLWDNLFYRPVYVENDPGRILADGDVGEKLKKPLLTDEEISRLKQYLGKPLGMSMLFKDLMSDLDEVAEADDIMIGIIEGQAFVNPAGEDLFSIVHTGESTATIWFGEIFLKYMLSPGLEAQAVRMFSHEIKHITDPDAAKAEHGTREYRSLRQSLRTEADIQEALYLSKTLLSYGEPSDVLKQVERVRNVRRSKLRIEVPEEFALDGEVTYMNFVDLQGVPHSVLVSKDKVALFKQMIRKTYGPGIDTRVLGAYASRRIAREIGSLSRRISVVKGHVLVPLSAIDTLKGNAVPYVYSGDGFIEIWPDSKIQDFTEVFTGGFEPMSAIDPDLDGPALALQIDPASGEWKQFAFNEEQHKVINEVVGRLRKGNIESRKGELYRLLDRHGRENDEEGRLKSLKSGKVKGVSLVVIPYQDFYDLVEKIALKRKVDFPEAWTFIAHAGTNRDLTGEDRSPRSLNLFILDSVAESLLMAERYEPDAIDSFLDHELGHLEDRIKGEIRAEEDVPDASKFLEYFLGSENIVEEEEGSHKEGKLEEWKRKYMSLLKRKPVNNEMLRGLGIVLMLLQEGENSTIIPETDEDLIRVLIRMLPVFHGIDEQVTDLLVKVKGSTIKLVLEGYAYAPGRTLKMYAAALLGERGVRVKNWNIILLEGVRHKEPHLSSLSARAIVTILKKYQVKDDVKNELLSAMKNEVRGYNGGFEREALIGMRLSEIGIEWTHPSSEVLRLQGIVFALAKYYKNMDFFLHMAPLFDRMKQFYQDNQDGEIWYDEGGFEYGVAVVLREIWKKDERFADCKNSKEFINRAMELRGDLGTASGKPGITHDAFNPKLAKLLEKGKGTTIFTSGKDVSENNTDAREDAKYKALRMAIADSIPVLSGVPFISRDFDGPNMTGQFNLKNLIRGRPVMGDPAVTAAAFSVVPNKIEIVLVESVPSNKNTLYYNKKKGKDAVIQVAHAGRGKDGDEKSLVIYLDKHFVDDHLTRNDILLQLIAEEMAEEIAKRNGYDARYVHNHLITSGQNAELYEEYTEYYKDIFGHSRSNFLYDTKRSIFIDGQNIASGKPEEEAVADDARLEDADKWVTGLWDLEQCKKQYEDNAAKNKKINLWRLRSSLFALSNRERTRFRAWAKEIDDKHKREGTIDDILKSSYYARYRPVYELWENLSPLDEGLSKYFSNDEEKQLYEKMRTVAAQNKIVAHGTGHDSASMKGYTLPMRNHWALLNIMLEGKIEAGEAGPIKDETFSDLDASNYGPYYVVLDELFDENKVSDEGQFYRKFRERSPSSEEMHSIYLVPRQESVDFLKQGLTRALELGLIDIEKMNTVLGKIMTYQQFVALKEEGAGPIGITYNEFANLVMRESDGMVVNIGDLSLSMTESLGVRDFSDIEGKDVLVLGCATGAVPFKAKEFGARTVTGVDMDEHSIKLAELFAPIRSDEIFMKNFYGSGNRDFATLVDRINDAPKEDTEGIKFLQQDIRDLSNFEDDSFDHVTVPYVFNRPGGIMFQHAVAKVIKEAVRIVRPGGVLNVCPANVGDLEGIYAGGKQLKKIEGIKGAYSVSLGVAQLPWKGSYEEFFRSTGLYGGEMDSVIVDEQFMQIMEALPIDEGTKVLGVGPGGSAFIEMYAALKGAQVDLVDPQKELLGYSYELFTTVIESAYQDKEAFKKWIEKHVKMIYGKLEEIDAKENSYDIVFLRAVFDAPGVMRYRVAESVISQLRPGGRLVFNTFGEYREDGDFPEMVLQKTAEKAGYKLVIERDDLKSADYPYDFDVTIYRLEELELEKSGTEGELPAEFESAVSEFLDTVVRRSLLSGGTVEDPEPIMVGLDKAFMKRFGSAERGYIQGVWNVFSKRLQNKLKRANINNVIIAEGEGAALSLDVRTKAAKYKVKPENMFILADEVTLVSGDLDEYKSTLDQKKAFIAVMDFSRLLEDKENLKPGYAHYSYLIEMITLALKMGSKEISVSDNEAIMATPYKGGGPRIFRFLPQPKAYDFGVLIKGYNAQERKLNISV